MHTLLNRVNLNYPIKDPYLRVIYPIYPMYTPCYLVTLLFNMIAVNKHR